MMVDAVVADKLHKRFGDFTALNDISFSIPHGTFVGLLGANGAGKTTTIAILLGLLSPDSGQVTILGKNMEKHRYALLGRMNFSSPYIDLPKRLTVAENLKVYGRLYTVLHLNDKIAELSDKLNLATLMKKTYGSLSAGQKTRVMFAKALLNDPELLLLDEPTASLDPDVAYRLREVLQEYAQQHQASVLIASHNMHEVESLCASIILMAQGTVVAHDTPQQLFNRYGKDTLEEVFLHIARDSQAV
jgi:ABC-2 type transport system ATP-binding protein